MYLNDDRTPERSRAGESLVVTKQSMTISHKLIINHHVAKVHVFNYKFRRNVYIVLHLY